MFNPTTNRSDSIVVAYLASVNQDNKSIEGLGLKVYGTIEDLSPQHDKLFVHIWEYVCAHCLTTTMAAKTSYPSDQSGCVW
jgi:hypothetical protein